MRRRRRPSNPVTDQPAEITAWQRRLEAEMDRCLPGEGQAPETLHQAMRYSALAGGKRFRPMLVYAMGKGLGLSTLVVFVSLV